MTELRRNEAWATVFLTLKDPKTGSTLKVTIGRRAFDRLDLALEEGETSPRLGSRRAVRAEGRARLTSDDDRANRPRRPPARARASQAEACCRGALCAYPKAATPTTPAGRRDPYRSGRRCTRRPGGHDRTAVPGDQGRDLRDTRSGKGGVGRDRGGVAGARRSSRRWTSSCSRAGAGASRTFSRSATRQSCARSPRPPFQWCQPWDTSRTRRSATWPPTLGQRRRLPRPRSWCRRSASYAQRSRARANELGRSARALLERDGRELTRLRGRLQVAPRLLLERRRSGVDHTGARLQALSPLATLGRGYAIVRAGALALRDASTVSPGDRLEIELASGGLGARVEDVEP